MSKCFVSVKVTPDKYESFEVPEPVYTYIMQLEAYVHFPEESGLKRLYKERFTKREDK